jgi:hypothetical protein
MTPHDPRSSSAQLEEWPTPYTPEEEQEVVKRLRELGYE